MLTFCFHASMVRNASPTAESTVFSVKIAKKRERKKKAIALHLRFSFYGGLTEL